MTEPVNQTSNILPTNITEHLEQFISIEDVPSSKGSNCKVTLSIPWPVAQQLAGIITPFLATTSQSVETRSKQEILRDQRTLQYQEERNERERNLRIALLHALKLVYRKGINYWEFCEKIKPAKLFCFSFLDRDRHKLYHDARTRNAKEMRKQGFTHSEVGKFYGVSEKSSYAILRRKIE